MNKALQQLKRSNPRLYEMFMKAVADNLGLQKREGALFCPNCRAALEISISQVPRGRTGRLRARRGQGAGARLLPINDLLIEVARQKKATTGTINIEFKRKFGRRITSLNSRQVRELKIKWLKSELAKHRSKGKAA